MRISSVTQSFLWVVLLTLCSMTAYGKENPLASEGPKIKKTASLRDEKEDCAPATFESDLAINNVRARLRTGGDIWWNGNDGRYIVPKVEPPLPEVSSIFAGAVWLGGYDTAGNLKLAAQTYRQSGNDFWPGPLSPDSGTVTRDICKNWDKIFSVTATEILKHRSILKQFTNANGEVENYPVDQMPGGVKGWPSRGNRFFFEIHGFDLPNTTQGLANFRDKDLDGNYEPDEGDYPIIEVKGCESVEVFGDEMDFWVYNDNGAPHTQTQGRPIQMEVQVQAFAFATNDELNDMTFYRYKLINRAPEDITQTYFAMWVDADLGCFRDDYIGCDTTNVGGKPRNLAYYYNADVLDGFPDGSCDCQGVNTYCNKIPVLGIDYFRGPNNEFGDELGMSSFQYFNNPGFGNPPPATGDPDIAIQYYYYMSGRWRDGSQVTLGGNGYNPNGVPAKYIFTDNPNKQAGWTMCGQNLPDYDRRTVQASGPFRLKPTAVNELIVGAVWVPDLDYPCPDITRFLTADDLAQALFDNCFKLTDGPDAPDVSIIELDKELILVLSNPQNPDLHNNSYEAYAEKDLRAPGTIEDSLYRFEGYLIYQLKDPTVSVGDFDDPSKAQLVAVVDKKNGAQDLYNWTAIPNPNPKLQDLVFIPSLKVEGSDSEIKHTFRILEDKFAKTDRKLINHKKYYFSAIAYAFNEYAPFDPKNPEVGQKLPFLSGRRNIKTYTGIPRPIKDKILNSSYGDAGVQITRLDGVGTGPNFLDITDATRKAIEDGFANNNFDKAIQYKSNRGPFSVTIYNPLDVVDGKYRLYFDDRDGDGKVTDTDYWRVENTATNESISSERNLQFFNEQLFNKFGFSISLAQAHEPQKKLVDQVLADKINGAIGFEIEYKDKSAPWISAAGDDLYTFETIGNFSQLAPIFDYIYPDAVEDNGLVRNGWMAPYGLCQWTISQTNQDAGVPWLISPIWSNAQFSPVIQNNFKFDELNNVDIVLTSDKSKWSRCVVLETSSDFYNAYPRIGNKKPFELRGSPSVGKDAGPDGKPAEDNTGTTGMGWFPGYAVDVETGERLNIFFGENSSFNYNNFPEEFLGQDVGADMAFNPNDKLFISEAGNDIAALYFGSQHFLFVTKESYDECAGLYDLFLESEKPNRLLRRAQALQKVNYVGIPLTAQGASMKSYADGLIPNDAVIKIRVGNRYKESVGQNINKGINVYEFELKGKQATTKTVAQAESILDQINVVPNPYYAYSAYEPDKFNTRVKITNLPAVCTITIYSIDGKFIRQFKRNEQVSQKSFDNPGVPNNQIHPDLEWDLRNSRNIPVASGVYLIHVDAGELGEKTIKWFGVAREFDPSGL